MSTRPDTLFPYTTLFRSVLDQARGAAPFGAFAATSPFPTAIAVAAQPQRQHPQYHAGQRRAADFRIGLHRARLEVGLRIDPVAGAGRNAPASALALVGAGLADRLDVQAVELETRAVALHARQSRVDDIVDARHRQRGLGDVVRQHDAPLRTQVEHPVLVARGQPRVQRKDLGVAVLAVFQRLMRVADLALSGKEDPRVPPRPFTRDLVAGGETPTQPRALAFLPPFPLARHVAKR